MPNLTPPTFQAITKPKFTKKPVILSKKPVILSKKPTPPSYPTGLIRSLFIGINYTGIPKIELKGCINDSINTRILVQQLYPSCKDIKYIYDTTDIKPTRTNILAAIDWLVSGLKPGQNVFFQYSGHGMRILDTNKDEKSGFDSCIIPYNGTELEIITDDELRILLANKIPAGCKLFAVFDCCNSGTALDLQCMWQCKKPGLLSYSQDMNYSMTRGNVIYLSACRDEEYAMDATNDEGVPSGALTSALLFVWKTYRTNIRYKNLIVDVSQYLKQRKFTQNPQLSSGLYIKTEEYLNLSN